MSFVVLAKTMGRLTKSKRMQFQDARGILVCGFCGCCLPVLFLPEVAFSSVQNPCFPKPECHLAEFHASVQLRCLDDARHREAACLLGKKVRDRFDDNLRKAQLRQAAGQAMMLMSVCISRSQERSLERVCF